MVSGESAREAFFTAKGLDLTEGFKILSGAVYNSRLTILNIPLTPFVFFSDSHGTRRHVQSSNREEYLSSTNGSRTSREICPCQRVSMISSGRQTSFNMLLQ